MRRLERRLKTLEAAARVKSGGRRVVPMVYEDPDAPGIFYTEDSAGVRGETLTEADLDRMVVRPGEIAVVIVVRNRGGLE